MQFFSALTSDATFSISFLSSLEWGSYGHHCTLPLMSWFKRNYKVILPQENAGGPQFKAMTRERTSSPAAAPVSGPHLGLALAVIHDHLPIGAIVAVPDLEFPHEHLVFPVLPPLNDDASHNFLFPQVHLEPLIYVWVRSGWQRPAGATSDQANIFRHPVSLPLV